MSAAAGGGWSREERRRALERAEAEGVDVLVIGGGITGAGVLRDAASRGLTALLLERRDFADGTSSRSSKMIHGGIRYIGEGQLRTTRESCRERDLLMRLNPNLVEPLPFLFPAYRGGKIPLWQVRALLWIYAALANFRKSARSRMLAPEEALDFCPDLRRQGLRGAGLYTDGQVDDVRLVLETVKSARRLGAEAANHAEVVEFRRGPDGLLEGVVARDLCEDRTWTIRARAVVNAAGPAVERVRGLDRRVLRPELRPAKGVHLVVPRHRLRTQGAVVFETADRRHAFVAPWGEMLLIGTTDAFSDEIDEPVVTIQEVHYLLSAANEAFPRAALTTNDLRAVFAGVRPLAASPEEETPSASVSREHRIYEDASGMISVVGGKLTTYRSMAEAIVDRAVRRLEPARRRAAGKSRTSELPLRDDAFEPAELEQLLCRRFALPRWRARYLMRTYGADAETLLATAPLELREPVGESRYTYAEVRWALTRECALSLPDCLERRLRLPIFGDSQGLPQLARISAVAAEAAGWDAARTDAEVAAYLDAVRRRYQIMAPKAPPTREDLDAAAA